MSLFTSIPPAGSGAMASDAPSTTNHRYPKRKRAEISYAPSEDSEDDWQSEEEETQSRKKTKQLPKKLPKHKIFPFMNLPAELRNKIYSYALSDVGGVFVTSRTKGYRRVAQRCIESECEPQYTSRWARYRNFNHGNDADAEEESIERRSLVPNLLATSKAIHAEAGSFLYSQPFNLADNYALLAFLTQIGAAHIKMLRDITINQWCGGRAHKSINFPAINLLSPATELRRLNIACSIGYFSSYSWRNGRTQEIPHRVARKVFRDCYPFLETYGKAKGDMQAAVDMIEIDEYNFSHSTQEIKQNLESFRKELLRLLTT